MWFSGASGNGDLFGPAQDPNAFQFGGKGNDINDNIAEGDAGHIVQGTDSATQMQNRYQGLADTALGRAAPTTDYSAGNAAASQGLNARAGQGNALAMIQNRAVGGGPSAATLGMNQGVNQSAESQIGAMAGARPGASGFAGQQAAGAASGNIGQIISGAGAARSAEIGGAQNSMFGGYQDMRGSDINGMKLQDARTQHDANAALQQRTLNQNAQLNYEGMGLDTANAQLGANIYNRQAQQAHRTTQGNLDVSSAQNASNNGQAVAGAVTAGLGAGFGAYTKSDARVKDNVSFVGAMLSRSR